MDIHCSTYLTDLYRYSLVYLDQCVQISRENLVGLAIL